MNINLILQPGTNHMIPLLRYSKHRYDTIQPDEINLSKMPLISPFQAYKYVRSKINADNPCYFDDYGTGYIRYFLKGLKSIFWCFDVALLRLNEVPLKTKLWVKFNTLGMRKAQRIITSSEDSKKEISEYAGYPLEKISVVYCAVDRALFRKFSQKAAELARSNVRKKYGLEEKEKLLLYVGGSQPKKNLPTLIKSVYELQKRMPVKLLIVGPEDWPNSHFRLRKLVAQLNIEKNVMFAGYVKYEELPDIYNSADVFVCPSYRESFGSPNLEALTCGCPVVTTNTSCIPEVVGDAAIKIDSPFDYNLLAKAVEDVLKNDALRNDMIKKGFKQADKFSWERHAKEVDKIFEEVWG